MPFSERLCAFANRISDLSMPSMGFSGNCFAKAMVESPVPQPESSTTGVLNAEIKRAAL